MAKTSKLSGHSRLKAALVLRDALARELGLPLNPAMRQLAAVESNLGAARGLAEGQYLHALASLCQGDSSWLADYDGKIRAACAQVRLAPRYAQYLALLLFAHWQQCQAESAAFLARLNEYLAGHQPKGETLAAFTESDLQFAAFWMATAAGKTHVLHAVLALLMEDGGWDRILLITPGDALTRQHAAKLRGLKQWEVFAYPHDGDSTALGRLPADTVIVLDINKLSENRRGEGVSIPTSVFQDGRNLVLVDEGHKGQKSEQSLWKKLQRDLAGIGAAEARHRGLLIEFSATFGQVVEVKPASDPEKKEKPVFDQYAESIVLDYAYDRFYGDLYGKDFWHVTLDSAGAAAAQTQQHTLAAALLAFWRQWQCYRDAEAQRLAAEKQVQVAAPLWVLLGLSVIGGKTTKSDQEQTSDVVAVLQFLAGILENPDRLQAALQEIRHARVTGADMLPPEVRAMLLDYPDSGALARRILADVFGWQPGDRPAWRLLKNAAGELGLGLSRADTVRYYGVVNVGDAGGLKKAMEDTGLSVADDALGQSLFATLDDNDSGIQVLIGSRRFAEGWDNYRASSLTLLRLGQGEGSLIIQMFGRVVRFAGTNGDGKRLERPGDLLKPLQTAYIYGLRSGYLEIFLNGLYANGVDRPVPLPCRTQANLPLPTPLQSVRSVAPEKAKFQVDIRGAEWLAGINQVHLSLAASVASAGLSGKGVNTAKGAVGEDITAQFKGYAHLLDQDALWRAMVEWRRQGWWNLRFDAEAIKAALHSRRYEITGLPLQLRNESDLAKLQGIAETLLRRMFEAAYRKQEARHSSYELIPAATSGIPEQYYKHQETASDG